MDKMERVIVYPYDVQFAPILRHKEFLRGYDIVGLVSPNGWSMCGKDAGCADGGEDIGLLISGDFDEALGGCDTVIFMESLNPLDFEGIVRPKINRAIEAGKNIVCTIKLEDRISDQLRNQCAEKGLYFKYYNNLEDGSNANGFDRKNIEAFKQYYEERFDELHDITTPVILVLGMGCRCNKFEIQLSLRESFLKMGYKVSQIGSRDYCEMLGFHSLPWFLYEDCMPEHKKIIAFNRYISKLEQQEKPDAIIIGVPGGLAAFNTKLTNKFGIMAYEIAQAAMPDTAVVSLLLENYLPENINSYLELTDNMVKYKLGTRVSCYNLANMAVDWMSSSEMKFMVYTSLKSQEIDEKKKALTCSSKPIFNVYNTDEASQMAEAVVNTLAGDQDVHAI